MKAYCMVGIGGALGALARYGLGLALPTPAIHGGFPWDYWIINISGSYIIGLIMALTLEFNRLSAEVRLLLGTGLMGGYTTFSTFILGVYQLLVSHHDLTATAYALFSTAAALMAAWLGLASIRLMMRWQEMRSNNQEAS